MAFPNATNFRIDGSTFNDARGNINYDQGTYNNTVQGDQNINVHGEQDIRSRVYSAMEYYIHTAAFHDSNERREISRCHPNTRKSALKTIADWIRNPASHCLWLNGPAGAGKSAIAYTIAEQCRADGTLGATYFFTKGSTSGSARGAPPLFSTLAYQLMSVFPDLDEHLWTAICADRTIFKRSLSFQLDKLIIQPLLELAKTSRFTSAVVVIDGLDECDGDSIQGEIVQLILGLKQHSLPLLFLISSRPEPVIRRAFEPSSCPSLARLPLVRSLDSDSDIRIYLRDKFSRISREIIDVGAPQATPQLPWPSTDAIEKLVRKSSGHFIYAATVIKFVQEGNTHPMDQLDAILGIPSEFTSLSAAGKNIFTYSIAFQELDGLYLYILRKHQNRVELVKILHTIIHFQNNLNDTNRIFSHDSFPGDIEIIFNLRPGSVLIMLAGLHSIIHIPASANEPLRFLHASFIDFLDDPERSHEFYMDTSHFSAELACAYMRLIVAFSESSGKMVGLAMFQLKDCLKATAGLLPATLEKLLNVLAQGLKSTPPCLLYVGLDFLLHNVLEEFPGAEGLRKYCESILERLEPQLIEISDTIIAIVRVFGAEDVQKKHFLSIKTDQLILLLGLNERSDNLRRALNRSPHTSTGSINDLWRRRVWGSLYCWLFAHHPPKKVHPTHMTVPQYTWAWAWDTYASEYQFIWANMDFVHYVDLIYGCLRLLQLEFGQPISPILPLVQQALKSATTLLARACVADRNCEHRPDILELIETVDFPSMLRALPDLTTTFCPKLFCLHRGLDELYSCLRSDGGFADPPLDGPHRPIPRYQEFLEIIYSRLLQDPLASCAVSVIYAVFEISYVSLGGIEEFLGLTPGELRRSTAMQGLFGPGSFEFSYSLGMLLKMGRVKLRPSHGYKSAHIDDYMGNAHGCLAFAYTERLNRGDSYARDHWSDHLRYAKPSERLFEMLRRVDIRAYDVKAVIQWLEKNPNIPKDVLARWRAAWVDTIHFYLAPRRPPICILDDMFERYCRLVCVRREPDSLATSFLSLAAPRGSDGLIPPRRMILGTII